MSLRETVSRVLALYGETGYSDLEEYSMRCWRPIDGAVMAPSNDKAECV